MAGLGRNGIRSPLSPGAVRKSSSVTAFLIFCGAGWNAGSPLRILPISANPFLPFIADHKASAVTLRLTTTKSIMGLVLGYVNGIVACGYSVYDTLCDKVAYYCY